MADFLSRQGKLGDALDWCEKAWQAGTSEAAVRVAVGLLRSGKGSADQARRVETWLGQSFQKKPTSQLQLSLAELRDFQKRYDEAIALYGEVLSREPKNALALNNLAWLLAMHAGRADKGLEVINQAITAVGPAPNLLDTRAVILLRLNQPGPAIKDLDQVVSRAPDASAHFHRASALLLAKNRVGAAEALKNAKAAGLQPSALHPLEHDTYHQVLAALDRK